MTGMYLEHYGVKGMKWGVRKEDKKTDRFSMTKSSTSISYFPHDNMVNTYDRYESLAKKSMDKKLNKKAAFWHNHVNDISGEKLDKMWSESYRDAVKKMDLSLEEQAALAAYAALVQYGIENIFDVVIITRDGKKTYAYRHRKTRDLFYTIGDAKAYTKREGRRSRKKNVQGEAVKVKANKNKSGGKKPVGYSEILNGTLKDAGKSFKQDKIIKDVKSTMSKIGKKKMSSLK